MKYKARSSMCPIHCAFVETNSNHKAESK